MHRRPLLSLLADYHERFPDEGATVAKIRALVESRIDCFRRDCWPGHITASTWIVNADRSRFLLTHHKKLNRWLQLGGHADGDPHVEAVALREAREESGMIDFRFWPTQSPATALDLDVHVIPARKHEPEHEHHDVRFLLLAPADQQLVISDESHALAWVSRAELLERTTEESVLRMMRKAEALYPS